MAKVEATVKITVDTKIAEDMLNCAGYYKFKKENNEIVKTLLSTLDCYGVTAEKIIDIKEKG